MSRRALFFLLLAIIALVIGLATGRALWFTMAYLLALLLIVSFVWAWANLRYTNLSRMTRTRRSQVGEVFEERMTAENSGWLPKLWLEIRDQSTFPGHSISQVVHSLMPRKKTPWRVRTLSRMRGRYRLGPLLLRTSDPFGLFPMQRKIDAQTNVIVYPLIVDIQQFPLPQGVLSGGEAVRKRTFHVTPNASGVREYVPGDSFGRIHWKSTARRNRLIVKEFELDPQVDVWIIPDMNAAEQMTRPGFQREIAIVTNGTADKPRTVKLAPATEEYVVTIAASIARHFLHQDRAVGMTAWGASRELMQPDRGERQINRILETFAVIRADGNTALTDVLLAETSRFQRGSTLVVVTPTTDRDWAMSARELQRRGFRVLTVLVDPAGFGSQFSGQNLYELMQASNLVTYKVEEGDDVAKVLNRIT